MKSISITIQEYENGGYVVEYTWDVEEEEDGETSVRASKSAFGDRDTLVRDVVQFLTETGDWSDEDDPEAEQAATQFLRR